MVHILLGESRPKETQGKPGQPCLGPQGCSTECGEKCDLTALLKYSAQLDGQLENTKSS